MLCVSQEISPNDEMFHDGNREHYFAVGHRAEKAIGTTLFAAEIEPDAVRSILDLPCGHGRVTRVLRAMFPNASIAGCDINRDGVDFCASTFDADPIYSTAEIEHIPIAGPYDLIWCGSLLTHFDPKTWPRWWRLFLGHLSPQGVAIVTLHGRYAAAKLAGGWSKLDKDRRSKLLAQYKSNRLAYVDYANGQGYGLSLAAPEQTFKLVSKVPAQVLLYMEQGWGTQDVIATKPRA